MIKELLDKLSEWITNNPICGSNEEGKSLNKKSGGGQGVTFERDNVMGPGKENGNSKASSQATTTK